MQIVSLSLSVLLHLLCRLTDSPIPCLSHAKAGNCGRCPSCSLGLRNLWWVGHVASRSS